MANAATHRGRPLHDSPKEGERWDLLFNERSRRDQSQTEAADECKVSQQTYSLWESAKRIPHPKHWTDLAKFVGVDIEELPQRFPTQFFLTSNTPKIVSSTTNCGKISVK